MSLANKNRNISFRFGFDPDSSGLKEILMNNPKAFPSVLGRIKSNSKGIINIIKLADYQHYFYTDVPTDPNPTDFFFFYNKYYWPIIKLLIKDENINNIGLFFNKINLDNSNFWRSCVINGLLFYACKSKCFQSTEYFLNRYKFDFRSFTEDRRVGAVECFKSILENERVDIFEKIIEKSNLRQRRVYCFRLFKASIVTYIKFRHFRILWDYLSEKDDNRTIEELIEASLEYDRPDIFDFLINDKKQSFRMLIDSQFYQWYNDLRHENQSRLVGLYLVKNYPNKLKNFIEKDFMNDAGDLCDVAVYNFRLPGNNFKELEVYLSIKNYDRSFAKKLYTTVLYQWLKRLSYNFHAEDRAERLMKLSKLLVDFAEMYNLSLEPFSKFFIKYCFRKLSLQQQYHKEFIKFAKYTCALLIFNNCSFNSYDNSLNDQELAKLLWLGLDGNISPSPKWLKDNKLPAVKPLSFLSSYVVRKNMRYPFSNSLDHLFGNNWILKHTVNFGSLLEGYLNFDLEKDNNLLIKSFEDHFDEDEEEDEEDEDNYCPISVPEHLRAENYVEPSYIIYKTTFRY